MPIKELHRADLARPSRPACGWNEHRELSSRGRDGALAQQKGFRCGVILACEKRRRLRDIHRRSTADRDERLRITFSRFVERFLQSAELSTPRNSRSKNAGGPRAEGAAAGDDENTADTGAMMQLR